MNNIYFVLGAADPEMTRIEELVREARFPICYAESSWGRVKPANAYSATNCGVPTNAKFVTVECEIKNRSPVHVIDHHRKGDTGYGVPAGRFLQGSSLGQTIAFLAANHELPASWESLPLCDVAERGTLQFHEELSKWLVHTRMGWAVIPDDLTLAAAADHCLVAAYGGGCPGVDPAALAEWCINSRARFQHLEPQNLREAVSAAKSKLDEAEEVCGLPGVKDMRPFGFVPELPEAAAQNGVAVLSEVASTNSRQKIVLLLANREQLELWPAWAAEQGLLDLYGGDPERGFAGGYLQD